ncbi:hypothetical protein BHE74_00049903 [Ensete ventricosum]|nr:hypothetical protein BHE74_00049903 [Ensete ventricosum]
MLPKTPNKHWKESERRISWVIKYFVEPGVVEDVDAPFVDNGRARTLAGGERPRSLPGEKHPQPPSERRRGRGSPEETRQRGRDRHVR